ncbi:hypothetical protein ACFVQB_19600 [Paenibacillus sp. NPDC057886]|uniref:hypothetical protein n=1 Tax=Paenibacillus sp. NPDC057886 TaxID=3346270 RepID=UPI0036C1583D
MLKKLIAVSLVAAMALPVTGAFASSNPTDRVKPNIQNGIDSRITVAPSADEVTIMSTTWLVTKDANIRKTPSPTGAVVISVYAGQGVELTSGHDYVVVNGVTWVPVTSKDGYSYSGYILLSALTEIG